MSYKRGVLAVAFVVVFRILPAVAQQSPEEQEVLKLEHDFGEALKQRDATTLRRILADDWLRTDPRGKVWTKAEYIEYVTTSQDTIAAIQADDVTTRFYGDTGIVTGRLSGSGTFGGKDGKFDLRFIDVLVKREGRWQVVASQETRRAEQ